jgi:uncharacterized integral membrane protein
MLALLIAVVFGLGIGYFATQNTIPVTIRLADYALEEVPLYLVVIGSLLVGLFIAWILYVAQSVSARLTLYGRDKAVRNSRRTVAELEQRIHDLEIDNARLRGEREAYPVERHPDDHPDHTYHRHRTSL